MVESTNSSSLYSLWSIQDSLLQYYRTMFLTAESLIIAVAASVSSTATAPALMLVFIGLVLLIVWIRVTGSRARDVSFTQELIKWNEAGRYVHSPLTTFKAYQAEWSKSGSYVVKFIDSSSETFKQDGVWPPRDCKPYQIWRWNARLQMERVLPAAYLLSWIAIVIYVVARAA
jgi:hypothetical protein